MSPFLIPIVAILAGTTMALAFPLVRAYARKLELEGQQPRVPRELADRLQHMEQAIDAIAVEVERIAEGQRFTTKLLAERSQGAALPPGAGLAASAHNEVTRAR